MGSTPSPYLLLSVLSFTPEDATVPGVLLISPGALRWTGEESPTPTHSPLPIISLLQRPLVQGHPANRQRGQIHSQGQRPWAGRQTRGLYLQQAAEDGRKPSDGAGPDQHCPAARL